MHAFESTRDEALLSIEGVAGATSEFAVRYPKAHGCAIANASVLPDRDREQANVVLDWDGQSTFLAFSAGSRAHISCPLRTPIGVTVALDFPGEMTVHNFVCGCETMGCHFLVLISFIIGLPMSITGVILLIREASRLFQRAGASAASLSLDADGPERTVVDGSRHHPGR